MIPEPSDHFATFTRKRRAGGSYVDGRWVDGAAEPDVDLVASVQPVSGRDLLRLPEGLRTRDTIAVITNGELRTANETAGLQADRLVVGGEEWEIVALDDWTTIPQLSHRDCLAQRADRVGLAP